jgi:hypothetical protein
MADLWDVTVSMNTTKGKPQTYPRPWPKSSKNIGANNNLSRQQVELALKQMNP